MKSKKQTLMSFFLLSGITLSVVFAAKYSLGRLLPEALTLTEGQRLELSTKLPVSARSEEDKNVLGITTKPLADAKHLELGAEITATPMQTGIADVTFYLCNSIPLKTVEARVLPKKELVPVGKAVGVTLDTRGLLVLGTGCVDGETEPAKGIVRSGDRILEANGVCMENKEAFLKTVRESKGKPLTLLLERQGTQKKVTLTPVYSKSDRRFQLGIWVRDSIQGIGTVTYYDPKTKAFGALGHGVYDVDTDGLMVIREGSLAAAQLTDVKKGSKGVPGELSGNVDLGEKLAQVRKNTTLGIFGKAEPSVFSKHRPLPLMPKEELKEGPAVMLSDFEDGQVREYAVCIEKLFPKGGKEHKDMMLRVTDETMLRKAGGIVQGMSGSPVLQNGRIVGAVTHVLVNDPTRGYGIFIENMLEAAENTK